jgi:hypothetical protein
MSNTTYFLGAGASAGTVRKDEQVEHQTTGIPIVKNTFISFASFKQQIRYLLGNNRLGLVGSEITDEAIKKEFLFYEYIIDIENELKYHGTFDTIARKYWLMGKKKELNRLKFIMNTFFTWLQSSKGIDKRYDKFLSIVLNKSLDNANLPSELKFITWNYDIQFELAMLPYTNDIGVFDVLCNKMGVIPYLDNDDPLNNYDSNRFHFVKLNGIAGVFDLQNSMRSIYDLGINSSEDISLLKDRMNNFNLNKLIEFLLTNQDNINDYYIGTLQFAFENSSRQKKSLEAAKQIMRETTKLIVIGYSFPYFNREIDVAILKELPEDAEIVIEDVNPPTEVLNDILKRQYERKIRITTVTDVSQFHIPFDFQHGKFFPERKHEPMYIGAGGQSY